MPILLLLFLTLWRAFALGSGFDAQFAQDLSRARNSAEIARLEGEFAKLKVAQAACRIQLAEKIAPVSCYEAVALEKRDPRERVRKLDRLCAAAAAALRLADPNAFVSTACAQSLREARKIHDYREEEGAEWSSY